MTKEYIGDGVYVEFIDDYTIKLTTGNGIEVTNEIILEAEVLENLNQYLKRAFNERYSKK